MSRGAAAEFRNRFGIDPVVVARAPGRVNLIGEHTDYSHLPVLPMAIDRSITVAAGPGREGIEAVSTARRKTVVLPAAKVPRWGRYLQGAVAILGKRAAGRGAQIAIDSDLPPTGGLSSSSALTVGTLWALNHVWGLGLHRGEVVDLAIRAERFVGVESGGMDQTVIAFAEEGAALRIDFEPPARRAVPIPEHFALVAGYSGAAAPKGSTAKDGYNRSVVSCRAAAMLLGRAIGVDAGDPPLLVHVAGAPAAAIARLPEETTALAVAAAAQIELARLAGLTVGTFPVDAPIYPRAAALHVLSESDRVDAAEAALGRGDGPELGRLLDASQASLAAYGVSTPGLDRLTAAACDAGAWGARLTGAGFGGWAVAACPPERSAVVVEAMAAATGGPAFPVAASAGLA